MVRGTHGDHSANCNISGVSVGSNLHKNRRFSGKPQVVRAGGRRSSDFEVGWWVVRGDILPGMGGAGAGFLLEVLYVCGR